MHFNLINHIKVIWTLLKYKIMMLEIQILNKQLLESILFTILHWKFLLKWAEKEKKTIYFN